MSKNKHKNNFKIPEPEISDQKIKFSFEFYDTGCDDYCLSKWGKDQILETLKRLREINQKTYFDLKREEYTFHFRPVDWEKTIKKTGFPYREANNLDAYHFALLGVNNKLARVFGAYSNNVFYIIWFDLNHEIWPSQLKNT
jgi:hypothetical protein